MNEHDLKSAVLDQLPSIESMEAAWAEFEDILKSPGLEGGEDEEGRFHMGGWGGSLEHAASQAAIPLVVAFPHLLAAYKKLLAVRA
jgi:hypothetical protein